MQLAAPFSALAATELANLRLPARRVLIAVAVAPSLFLAGWVYAGQRPTWSMRSADDWRAQLNEQVGEWFATRHIDHPNLYVMCASAGMYSSTNAVPGYPFLWFTEVQHGRHARQRLATYLADSEHGPEYVARVQTVKACDPSGHSEEILTRDFRQVGTVGPVVILQRDK